MGWWAISDPPGHFVLQLTPCDFLSWKSFRTEVWAELLAEPLYLKDHFSASRWVHVQLCNKGLEEEVPKNGSEKAAIRIHLHCSKCYKQPTRKIIAQNSVYELLWWQQSVPRYHLPCVLVRLDSKTTVVKKCACIWRVTLKQRWCFQETATEMKQFIYSQLYYNTCSHVVYDPFLLLEEKV